MKKGKDKVDMKKKDGSTRGGGLNRGKETLLVYCPAVK